MADRATIPGARLAAGALVVVAGLVVLNIVWTPDEGTTDQAEEPDETQDPDETREPDPTTSLPPSSEPATEPAPGGSPFAAIEGFEDRWLVVTDRGAGEILHASLGGGVLSEVEVDVHPSQIGLPAVLVRGVLVSPMGGLSLHDGRWWSLSGAEDAGSGRGRVVGSTSGGGALIAAGDRVVEWWTDDMRRQEGVQSPVVAQGQGEVVGVSGRQVVHDGPSGIFRFDLDDRSVVGLGPGEVHAVGTGVALVNVCDETLRCELRIIDLADGATRSVVDPSARDAGVVGSAEPLWGHRFSPDGERLALVRRDGVAVVDVDTGEVLGVVPTPAPDRFRWGPASTLWAPDASAGLVMLPVAPLDADEPDRIVVAWFDRDAREVRRLDDLSAALGSPGSGPHQFLLSDTGFGPEGG